MMQRVSLAVAIAMLATMAIAEAQTQPPPSPREAGAKSFAPPRTPWGDPDLQGVWPGTEMVGVPLQRQQQFGERNTLTDEEFKARVRQAQQTEEESLSDFDVTTADTRNAGAVGSA